MKRILPFLIGFTLLSVSTSGAAPNRSLLTGNPVMTESENALTVRITIMAHEEKLPPLGVPVDPNRDIAFVSVLTRLENPVEKKVKITIEKIEIRDASNNRLPDFQFSPRPIEVNPLENSELVFSVTSKTGYAGHDRVKAVLFYRIGNRQKVIESKIVNVNSG